MKLEATEVAMLGQAQKIIASKDDTTIVGGKGKKKDIEARVSEIKALIEKSKSEYDREDVYKRQSLSMPPRFLTWIRPWNIQ